MHGLMAATLRKLEDAPILIVTHEGFLDLQAAEAATVQVAEALAQAEEPLYGIIDLRAATTSFPEVLRILHHQSQGRLGTLSTDRGRIVLVGSHPLIRIFRKLFRLDEFGGLVLPIFSSLDEALVALRAKIEEDRQNGTVPS